MTGEGRDRPPGELRIRPLVGLPEIAKGDDLAAMIAARAPDLADGDVVVVASKVVSKSEGRVVPGLDRDAATSAETVRVVARRGPTRIVETRHGFVMAAAGVDASNVEPGSVVLLPEDPDSSARQLRQGLRDRLGVRIGVVVTDTFGRPWRNGQTDLAIGAAGVPVLVPYGGRSDGYGNPLAVTAPALADELAAAADLAKPKLAGVPVAIVSGLDVVTVEDGTGVRALVRDAAADMFRLGTREAMRQAVRGSVDGASPGSGQVAGQVAGPVAGPVDRDAVEALVAEANALPADPRFVLLDGAPRAEALRGAAPFPALAEVVAVHLSDPPTSQTLLHAGASIDRLRLALAVEGFQTRWVDTADPANLTSQSGAKPVPAPLGWLLIGIATPDGQ